MKKEKKILIKGIKPYYIGDFKDKMSVMQEFSNGWNQVDIDILNAFKGVHILLAYYLSENYSGTAYVVFEKRGKLYEVEGSHCSCYGLEGQWEPAEIPLELLNNYVDKGQKGIDSWYSVQYRDELVELVKKLNKLNK